MKVTGKLVDKTTPFMLKGMLRPHSVAAFLFVLPFWCVITRPVNCRSFMLGKT